MNKRLLNIRDSYDAQIIATIIFKDGCYIQADKMQKEITKLQSESEDGLCYIDILNWILQSEYNQYIDMMINVGNDYIDTIWI